MLLKSLAGLLLAAVLAADPFTYEYSGTTDAKGGAQITIVANENVENLEVVIKGDGKSIKKTFSMAKGSRQKITWQQSSKEARYEMHIQGSGVEADFAFEVVKSRPQAKLGKLRFKSSRKDILERHTATYETPFAISSYEYKVIDSDGDTVAAKTVAPADVPAGGSFTIEWTPGVEVFMIDVRAEDEYGQWAEDRRVPWAVEIPHTEINFDSGKWDIKNDEVAKLDEALAVAFHELVALEKVNKAVGASLTPQLYIVGYTDTVGPTGSNDKLSNSRAKEIAKYFHSHGFWAEIYYAGMGERALRVETGDNVDEVRNRRALYLIGVQQPAAGGQIPARWSKLSGARTKPAGFTLPTLPDKWKDYRENRKAAGGQVVEGGGSGGDDDGGGGDSAGGPAPAFDENAGAGGDDGSSEYEGDGYGGDEGGGPPPVEGEPGATGKGCSIGGFGAGAGMALGVFVVVVAGGRRRLRLG